MKQWRVGTISMGSTLVLLGCVLFASQWQGKEALQVLMTWWPIVFILLGLELLIFIAVSRLAQPIVKYDMLSIFFVGIICIVCIGFVTLASTGMLQEVRYAVSSYEQTWELPHKQQSLTEQVTRIVVTNSQRHAIHIDYSSDQAVHTFGYLHAVATEEDNSRLDVADVAVIRVIGDTMYVDVKQPPTRHSLIRSVSRLNVTIVLPRGVQSVIQGHHALINPA